MKRPLRDRMVSQCIQSLGRLAFKGVEVEMIRVQPPIVEGLKKALGDSRLAGRVNPTLPNQTRSIMYVYSGTKRAAEYVRELKGLLDREGMMALPTRVEALRIKKYAQLKPVGILIPASWGEFAQQITDSLFREKSKENDS